MGEYGKMGECGKKGECGSVEHGAKSISSVRVWIMRFVDRWVCEIERARR